MCYVKVKSVTPAGVEPVYNMTVDEHHNYLIRGGVILKNCDAARYFAITRTLGAELMEPRDDYDDEGFADYDDEMTGGEMNDDYLSYGGD